MDYRWARHSDGHGTHTLFSPVDRTMPTLCQSCALLSHGALASPRAWNNLCPLSRFTPLQSPVLNHWADGTIRASCFSTVHFNLETGLFLRRARWHVWERCISPHQRGKKLLFGWYCPLLSLTLSSHRVIDLAVQYLACHSIVIASSVVYLWVGEFL